MEKIEYKKMSQSPLKVSIDKIPLEKRLDGKIICKFQRAESNTTYCIENRKDCIYIEQSVSLEMQSDVEGKNGRKGFYLCSLNCNEWLYGENK